jgi:osmotically-inducible protein OsmY
MNSDAKIRDDVIAELDFDPQIDAAAIGVTVHDGVVTLSGHVPNLMQKLAAEAAAERVKGVKGLAQDIEIRLATQASHSDEELVERASHVLNWTISGPKTGVKVRAENGWITLRGEALWAYQKQEAEKALRHLEGVKGVTNLITVHSDVKPGDVKGSIKRAFHRNAEIEAGRIDVLVDGTSVTLTGKADNWAQRRAAEQAAWAAPGVSQVIDNILIS